VHVTHSNVHRPISRLSAGELTTWAAGDVSDKIGEPADNGQLGVVDPECRLIGLHLYDGMFKVRGADWWWPMDTATITQQHRYPFIPNNIICTGH